HESDYVDRLACELRERLLEACADADVRLYATYRTEDERWIEALVAAGVGLAVLPAHSVSVAGEGPFVVRPLVEPALHRTVLFWRNVDHPYTAAAKAFWDCVRREIDGAGDA
ncbi:MAG: LysR family transcriptional regulator substrate-binding protein, partial [Myxococcota bacterium]